MVGAAGSNQTANITTTKFTFNASTGALTASALNITGNAVVGNLDVLGNVTYINSTITTIVDPIIELNTGANGAPLSGSAPYDSGIKTHYWDGVADRQSFFGRTNDTGYFEFYSNVTSETGNVVTGTYGTIKSGNLVITSTTPATSNVTGAVQISGGVGVAGNVYVGQRVGFVAANSVSVVYQIYNAATNSLDTIFG
jgi:hypothetical protein